VNEMEIINAVIGTLIALGIKFIFKKLNEKYRFYKGRCERCGNSFISGYWHTYGIKEGKMCENCHKIYDIKKFKKKQKQIKK